MEGRALTVKELMAAMHDIRLPADAPGGFLAELFAAIGLGLAFALALSFLLSFFSMKRVTRSQQSLAEKVAAANALEGDARVIELMHLLKAVNPDAAKSFAGSMYQQSGLPDPMVLERAVLEGAAR